MTNDAEAIDDDGFSGSLYSSRLTKGTFLKWTDTVHWQDRDGLTPPLPLLVIAINEVLQRWKDGKATVIADKPLPDPEQLNSTIPTSEWERGIDGQPRKPWAHVVVVYFVNLATGEFYTYAAATTGAHIAFAALKEAVITMRALRGKRVMPIVNLSERPFKTNFGMRRRPHLEIIGWKTPGDDTKTVAAASPTPQLTGPVAAPIPAQVDPTPAAASAVTRIPTPTEAQPGQKKPKPSVNLAAETLAVMGDVKAVTSNELFDDEIPW
jgi:hypothetical protein